MALELMMASLTGVGSRSENEDALICQPNLGDHWLACVADGAGGHARGAEASRRVVSRLESELDRDNVHFDPDTLADAVLLAHEDLLNGSASSSQRSADASQRMHSTVVVLWGERSGGRLLWCHVGDSRLYRIRNGVCQALTRDDSAIQSLVDAGMLTAEQAVRHPNRSQLLAALGMTEPIEPTVLDQPTYAQSGDAYLLCSDGWWEGLTPQVITETLSRASRPEGWLRTMELHLKEQRLPNQDNFSAVAVWMDDPASTVIPIAVGSA